MAVPKLHQKYSYADYVTWPENERWELIDGEVYDMSPAPKRVHQEITGNIFTQFANYLDDKTCQVFIAPFDVRLYTGIQRDEDVTTVVQPDISVFCDDSKLDDNGAHAAPDLIVEVLSSSTRDKDLNRKLLLYQRHKVTEYWIIDPENKNLLQFILIDGLYDLIKEYGVDEVISPSIFADFVLPLNKVFK